jgi:hypothetical protein
MAEPCVKGSLVRLQMTRSADEDTLAFRAHRTI